MKNRKTVRKRESPTKKLEKEIVRLRKKVEILSEQMLRANVCIGQVFDTLHRHYIPKSDSAAAFITQHAAEELIIMDLTAKES